MNTVSKQLLNLFSLFFLLWLAGCGSISTNCKEISPGGEPTTHSLDLPEFDKVQIDAPIQVVFIPASGGVTELVCPPRWKDYIQVKVEKGTLKISSEICIPKPEDAKLFLTISELKRVDMTGSGKLISDYPLITHELKLSLSGSGRMQMKFNVYDLEARLDGSGQMVLEGTSSIGSLALNGSGMLDCRNLHTGKTDALLNGSGKMLVYGAGRELDMKINGSGNIFYEGWEKLKPTMEVNGSGKVQKGFPSI